jgi:hypothetical protein
MISKEKVWQRKLIENGRIFNGNCYGKTWSKFSIKIFKNPVEKLIESPIKSHLGQSRKPLSNLQIDN